MQAAQQCFELALSFSNGSSSETSMIKSAIEKLGIVDEDEDEEV